MRGQRHAPAAPYTRESPGTHCTGGCVGLRTGLNWCGKSRPTGIRSPDRPARRQSLYRLLYPAHWSKEMPCRHSRFSIVKNILETITHVGILEQNSTNLSYSRLWRCRVWIASGVKRKIVSEVLRKYDVCVCVCVCEVRWYFWHHHAKTHIHKSWSWNFLRKIGTRNRNVSKINWKLYIYKINFLHLGTKYLYWIFLTEVSLIYSKHNADYCIISLPLVHII